MKPIARNAEKKLTLLKDDMNTINGLLTKARTILIEIISQDEVTVEKCRSMVDNVPPRLNFTHCNLPLYIDFTIISSASTDELALNGSIIYGVSRTLCFKNIPECTDCQRTERCDNLEDKPLIKFTVNKHGLIEDRSKIDKEWWIDIPEEGNSGQVQEKEKNELLDMHYNALANIWKDALDWTNENILP